MHTDGHRWSHALSGRGSCGQSGVADGSNRRYSVGQGQLMPTQMDTDAASDRAEFRSQRPASRAADEAPESTTKAQRHEGQDEGRS